MFYALIGKYKFKIIKLLGKPQSLSLSPKTKKRISRTTWRASTITSRTSRNCSQANILCDHLYGNMALLKVQKNKYLKSLGIKEKSLCKKSKLFNCISIM